MKLTKEEIQNELIRIFKEKLNISIDQNSFQKTYLDIGINSILFVKLLVNIEMSIDIEFEEEIINIAQGHVLADLVTYIEEKIN